MAHDDKELVALVTWLQTFEVFPHRIVDGQNGKVALETVLDALNNQATTRSISKVAEEVCGPLENSVVNQSADEIWTSLLIMSSTRARPLTESPVTDRKQMSSSRLKLYVLSNLLDCAVQCSDLDRRRVYIQNILRLSKSTQATLMSLIEKRTKTSKKTPTKNNSASKAGSSSNDSKRRSSSASREQRHSAHNNNITAQQTPPRASTSRSASYNTPERDTSGRPPSQSRARPSSNMSPSGYTPATSRRRTDSMILTPGTMDSPNAIQSIVSDLHTRNEKLETMLETYKKREAELQANLDAIHGDYRKQMLRMENGQRDQMQDMETEYKDKIQQLTNELQRNRELAEQGQQAIKDLAVARDELDVLQHSARQLQDTQEKLRRVKEKLAELQNIKDAYEKEQDRHSKSIEECIRLEHEVEQLKGCKRLLDEYKNRAIQAEVKLVECQDYLKRLERETSQQSATNEALMQGTVMQQQQLEEMRRRMEQEAEELNVRGAGIGEGISEFNSEVAEELTRLRNENLQLRVFASKRQNDAVERLERALDDAKLLAEQYKEQFLNIKQNLATTQVNLQEGVAREAMLKEEIARVKHHLMELEHSKQLVQEQLDRCEKELNMTQLRLDEANQRLASTRDELDQWKRRAREVEDESAERLSMWQSAQHELEETNRELNETGQTVLELQERLSYYEEQVEQLQQSEQTLRQAIQDRDGDIDDLKHRLDEKEKSLTDARNRMEDLRSQLARAQEKIDRAMDNNKKLSSQLEDEKQARFEAAEEAHKSLEETRKLLEQKHKKEYDEMLGNMNCQLDDEKRASRRKDEDSEMRMRTLDDEWRTRYDEIEKQLSDTRQQTHQHIQLLKQEHAAELQQYREEAEASRNDLIQRGNALLEESKAKASREIAYLEEQLQTAVHEKQVADNVLHDHVAETRIKNKESSIRQLTMQRENEDLAERLRSSEQDLAKLQEDNERYKRQLGGHGSGDDALKAENERLRREFQAIMQENANLKRESRGMHDNEEFCSDGPTVYSRNGKRTDTYNQMRHDYEAQINALNDDKRQLLMDLYAATASTRKADERAWALEAKLKEKEGEIAELQHALSMRERMGDESVESFGPIENHAPGEEASFYSEKNLSFHTAHSGSTPPYSTETTSDRRIRTPNHSPSIEKAMKNRASQEKNLRSHISMLNRRTPPPAPRFSPQRSGGGVPRSVSGQRFKTGMSLLDSELMTSNDSIHTNVLSPSKKQEYQTNQQQRLSHSSPDLLGLRSNAFPSAKKPSPSFTRGSNLVEVTMRDQAQTNTDANDPESCKTS